MRGGRFLVVAGKKPVQVHRCRLSATRETPAARPGKPPPARTRRSRGHPHGTQGRDPGGCTNAAPAPRKEPWQARGSKGEIPAGEAPSCTGEETCECAGAASAPRGKPRQAGWLGKAPSLCEHTQGRGSHGSRRRGLGEHGETPAGKFISNLEPPAQPPCYL